jgi:nitrite reductase/ring-hydroxylating ferredoxin subunit
MAFVRVASVSEVQPGWVKEVRVDGKTYAICNSGGEIHALDGSCPCTGGPLGQGALREDLLVCPWHGWRFDCRTGASAYDPNITVARFPVRILGDDIFVEIKGSTIKPRFPSQPESPGSTFSRKD